MIGEVISGAGSTPAGFLFCNGAAISRTSYAELFAVIGTRYGIGDGSTTFNVPEFRGHFLRGYAHGSANDPDRATRTDRGDGTTGDAVGTKQASSMGTHVHTTVGTTQFGDNTANVSRGGYPTQAPGSVTGEARPTNIYDIACIQYE